MKPSLCSFVFACALAGASHAAAVRHDVLAGLPLRFELNGGQTAPEVRYLARSAGQIIYFTDSGVVFQVRGSKNDAAVVMKFAGGGKLDPKAETMLPGRVHYLTAGSVTGRNGLPTFSRLRCRGVYPGVDLVFYGTEGRLEYDFVLAAGADPGKLRVVFEGAEAIRIDEAGDLVVSTAAGPMRQHAPVAYQRTAEGRRTVNVAYALETPDRVSFRLGAYDRTRALTVDPVISFSTFLGGSGMDDARAVAVDAQGSVYVAGTTASANFPVTSGAVGPSYQAGQTPGDVFVARLDANGASVRYATFIGGTRTDVATSIAVDSTGAVYIGGYTDSQDFPVSAGAFQRQNRSFGAFTEGFVAKLSSDGSGLVYSTYLGQTFTERVNAIAVDASGNAFLAGATDSSNFPTTPGAFHSLTCTGGGFRAFVTKLSASGGSQLYSTTICGSSNDEALAIAIDADGNAYVAGSTTSTDFPATPGALRTTSGGDGNEAWVAKVNPSGSALLYATYLGGTAADVVTGIAVDAQRNAYVTGYTRSADFPASAGAWQPAHGDNGLFEDAFVAVLNPAGAALTHATFLGGSGQDIASAIAVDSAGAVYVAGSTTSRDFPVTAGPCQPTYAGGWDAFVVKLSLAEARLDYAALLGGWENDRAQGIALDAGGNAYIAGYTGSRNFTTTQGAYRSAYASGYQGAGDAFVARVTSAAAPASPCIAVNGIVSAASFLPGALSPGLIFSLFGAGLGPVEPVLFTVGPSGILDKVLAGTRVLFDQEPAPIIFTSAGQVNAIAPYEIAGKQSVRVRVEYQGGATPHVVVPVAPSQPGVFSQDVSGRGAGAILNQDYSVNTPANPAEKDSIIQIYATGEGQTSPPGVSGRVATDTLPTPQLGVVVTIGGVQAPIHYAGAAPTLVSGVLQINAQVPANAPSGRAVPVVVRVGDNPSPAGITVAIR
ncbi:MAG: SBBP repeat-containing protein [Bryobacteraceae bacterium]|nr:SBBP repeat-containing protein [Bryobacteraceae bacterium]